MKAEFTKYDDIHMIDSDFDSGDLDFAVTHFDLNLTLTLGAKHLFIGILLSSIPAMTSFICPGLP
ncbi:hypothetical protein BT96DRAFT_452574 [Gymnopus androsaceus JB14]|uniref:Uncharacterized protein n=1 Tax=Gymnopus androsaceus JB14 TaxID=1447944 RepID=A0A6A4I531_9AGAR|nr:hypothetical protein BT96DRAFT_452574 [Gymnopus androsaceus JB14]